MGPRRQRGTVGVLVAVVTAALAACAGAEPVTFGSPATAPAPPAGAESAVGGLVTSSDSAGGDPDAVGGLVPAAPGATGSAGQGRDVPPIPDIVIPDVTVVDTSAKALQTKIGTVVNPVKGVTVTGAVCNGGTVVTRAGVNFGDGSGVINRGGGASTNAGDGSGVVTQGKVRIVNGGKGSGTYTDGTVSIVNSGDGSGTYTDGTVDVVIAGNGSGTYSDGTVKIVNAGDGSGTYSDGTVDIVNAGDGSGTYSDGVVEVTNTGKGEGIVNGRRVPMDPIAPVAPIGKLPPMKALRPLGKDCGTLIRLADRVLFDFDSARLRSEAGPVLDAVAAALTDRSGVLTVFGHTDSLGTDAYNADLSKRRANAVATALRERGVSATITAVGVGEKQPVAQNSIGGKDNPGGRQLNRRVEILVPGA